MVSPYLAGLAFLPDGSFEELMMHCGESRKNHSGKWTLEDNIITVKMATALTWKFQLLSMDENTIDAVFWIEK
jgi:hypothetical protein